MVIDPSSQSMFINRQKRHHNKSSVVGSVLDLIQSSRFAFETEFVAAGSPVYELYRHVERENKKLQSYYFHVLPIIIII